MCTSTHRWCQRSRGPLNNAVRGVAQQDSALFRGLLASVPWGRGTTGAAGVVTLPSGRRVRGRGLRRGAVGDVVPELGIHLLGRQPPPTPWPALWVRWPDFRLPADREQADRVLREAHDRAAGERVELACLGGRGRTGTALAVLALLDGVPPAEAVAWVRRHYDPHAVETPWQRRFVRGYRR